MLATWAAGLALASAAVARWQVVGPGYVWLSGGVVLLLAVPAAMAGGGVWAWAGSLLVAAGLVGSRHQAATVLYGGGGAALLVAAVPDGGLAASLSGSVLLGGVTAAMMLGHWFLVDPRLPRRALRRLVTPAVAGGVADPGVLVWLGAVPWAAGDLAVGVGYLLLAVFTVVLMGAVWSALGEEGYPAVMAATGLSYLAVLTAIGAVVLGRLLVEGSVLG